ncbi:MAG: hypothetical protein Q8O75_00700 [bacterium]|nr:hypothetical protein [bacterium]
MPENLQPETNQPKPSHKINWKNILIGVVVGILLIGGGVAIWLMLGQPSTKLPSQTPISTPSSQTSTPSAQKDETAGWKTYKDESISIKYPASWNRYDSISEPSFSEKDPSSVSPGLVVPTVAILSSPDLSVYNTDFDGLFDANTGDTWDSGAKHYEKLENLNVDGQKAVWIRQTLNPDIPSSGPSIDHVYAFKDSKIYEISLWTNDEGELKNYTNIFKKILSTFKFLD